MRSYFAESTVASFAIQCYVVACISIAGQQVIRGNLQRLTDLNDILQPQSFFPKLCRGNGLIRKLTVSFFDLQAPELRYPNQQVTRS